MAPSRRRSGTNKVSVAGARRQWKVGDLVLAKVKGFPAWPATVSEPEKWGYRANCKKVVVYFFGTKQIAFCNPVDIEAFTEEKGEYLLVNRHGKGAGFVRAVREIISSYKKLKNQDNDTNVHLDHGLAATSNFVESLVDSNVKDQALKAKTYQESAGSSNSEDFPVEVESDATKRDALPESHVQLKDSTGNMMATETPMPTTYSRKNRGVIQAENFVAQKRVLSTQRSKISSDVDAHKFQNSIIPSSNGKNIHAATSAIKCSDQGDAELSLKLDFQANATIVKKKRKPSKKRANNGTTECIARLDEEADSEAEVHKFGDVLLSDLKILNGNNSKGNGDEHLPLVKRARIRMGRPSSEVVGEQDPLVQEEEKPFEVSDSRPELPRTSLNSEEDNPVDQNSFVAMVDLANSSPLNKCPEDKPKLWEVKKLVGCSLDGEAALPPLKRLHRALEAMSANAAEDS